MKLKIEIDLDGDPFYNGYGREEIERILDDLKTRLPDDIKCSVVVFALHDKYGTWVGEAKVVGPHDDNDD